MTFILFGILQLPPKTFNYFVRYNTVKECVDARKSLERKYGFHNFSGFCAIEVVE
jgi:hypothetical protein